MRMLLIAFLAVFAFAACSSGGGDSTTQESTAATETESHAPAETEAEATTVAVLTGDVAISGKLGCGHCTHGIGDGCSAAVQTADGAIYILEGMAEGEAPFDQRFDGKQISVSGTSVERDGVGYITVASFDL
jgi:hypothetical protein